MGANCYWLFESSAWFARGALARPLREYVIRARGRKPFAPLRRGCRVVVRCTVWVDAGWFGGWFVPFLAGPGVLYYLMRLKLTGGLRRRSSREFLLAHRCDAIAVWGLRKYVTLWPTDLLRVQLYMLSGFVPTPTWGSFAFAVLLASRYLTSSVDNELLVSVWIHKLCLWGSAGAVWYGDLPAGERERTGVRDNVRGCISCVLLRLHAGLNLTVIGQKCSYEIYAVNSNIPRALGGFFPRFNLLHSDFRKVKVKVWAWGKPRWIL